MVRRDVQEPRQAQVETYYYDGVRRIREELDSDPADPNSPIAAREYVWGPEYVDEALCLIVPDPCGPPAVYYFLQDANYNVVALLDPNGAVLAQYQYEPYGSVVAADVDPNAPANRLGHQGLFYERLYYDPNVPLTAPALEPSAPWALSPPLGVYVVRNRVLLPHLGRWAQRDMNETALPILTALAMNGETLASFFGAFDAEVHYDDGLNLYAYAGSNPVNRADPLGLDPWDDPFSETDDVIADIYGERAAAVATLADQIHMTFDVMSALAAALLQFVVGDPSESAIGFSYFVVSFGDEDDGMMRAGFPGGLLCRARLVNRLFKAFALAMRAYRKAKALAGELHHAISRRIWKALEANSATRGNYRYRDSRFVTRAKEAPSHRGYQKWHRLLDKEIADWIRNNKPTPEQFEAFLRARYAMPDLLTRFPQGL